MSQKPAKNLIISHCNRLYGRAEGGDVISLRTSCTDPDNVKAEFLKLDVFSNRILWRSFATIVRTIVANDSTIYSKMVLKTPKHKVDDANKRTKVYIRLLSTGSDSRGNKWPFFYCSKSTYNEYCTVLGYSSALYATKDQKRTRGFKKDLIQRTLQDGNNNMDIESGSLLRLAQTRSLREFIVPYRSELDTPDADGNTAIHLALMYGNLDLFALFVDMASLDLINKKNKKSISALILAAYLDDAVVCDYLLTANADYKSVDLLGNNILHVACKNNSQSVIRVLIKHPSIMQDKNFLNAINVEGQTPLHLAAKNDAIDVFTEVFENCKHLFDTNVGDHHGYTVLHYAAVKAKLAPVVNTLIRCPNTNVNALSLKGTTPVQISIANKNYMSTIALIAKGADTTLQNRIRIHPTDSTWVDFNKAALCLQTHLEFILSDKNTTHYIIPPENLLRPLSIPYGLVGDEAEFDNSFDGLYYTKGDNWMAEILKAPATQSVRFMLKIICFDLLKDFISTDLGLTKNVVDKCIASARLGLENAKKTF